MLKRLPVLHIVLAVCALLLWCAGAFTAQRAAAGCETVAARFPSGGVSPAQLERQLEIFRQDGLKGAPELTLWAEHAAQTLKAGEDASARAPVLELYGLAEDACSAAPVRGAFPARGDPRGCAVSEGAAFALWGGGNVLGQSVLWEGRTYYVQGVLKGEEALMVVQQSAEAQAPMPNMQLRFASGGSRQAAEEFLSRTDFRGAQLLDMPLAGWLLRFIAFLPALFMGIWMLARLLLEALRMRLDSRGRKDLPKFLRRLPLLLALGAADVFLITRGPKLPAALIPSAWSDFSFWSDLTSNASQRVKDWLAYPLGRDIELLFALLGTAFIIGLALLLLSMLMGKVKITKPAYVLIGGAGSLLGMFLMALYYARRGGLSVSLGMWLMPCLWMLCDYLLGGKEAAHEEA